MRILIDNKTGTMTLIPECDEDNRLLFHLINCNDLYEFSHYIRCETTDSQPMTSDLDVTEQQLNTYPSKTEWDRSETAREQRSSQDGVNRILGNLIGFKV